MIGSKRNSRVTPLTKLRITSTWRVRPLSFEARCRDIATLILYGNYVSVELNGELEALESY